MAAAPLSAHIVPGPWPGQPVSSFQRIPNFANMLIGRTSPATLGGWYRDGNPVMWASSVNHGGLNEIWFGPGAPMPDSIGRVCPLDRHGLANVLASTFKAKFDLDLIVRYVTYYYH